jgi:hypothetical protein
LYLRTFWKTPAINKSLSNYAFWNLRVNLVLATKSRVMRTRINAYKSARIRLLGTRCRWAASYTLRLLFILANSLPSETGLAAETNRTGLRENEFFESRYCIRVIQRFSALTDMLQAVRVTHNLKPNVQSGLKGGDGAAHHVTLAASGQVSL